MPVPSERRSTMHTSRLAVLAAAPLALAALVSPTAPASAGIQFHGGSVNALDVNAIGSNALAPNALGQNPLSATAIATTGSALDELDGVTVEAVVLPGAPGCARARRPAPARSPSRPGGRRSRRPPRRSGASRSTAPASS